MSVYRDSALGSHVDERIRSELGSGEQLLWAGRPRQGIVFYAADFFLVPFTVLWLGFAVFWELSALQGDAPLLFRLWGIPFVVVGLYVVFGRFIVDVHRRRRTVYGLTTERIIILCDQLGTSVRSIPLASIVDCCLAERGDGSGDIVLGQPSSVSWLLPPSWPGAHSRLPPTLSRIDDARSAYDLIRATQRIAAG